MKTEYFHGVQGEEDSDLGGRSLTHADIVNIADHEAGHLFAGLLMHDPESTPYYPQYIHISRIPNTVAEALSNVIVVTSGKVHVCTTHPPKMTIRDQITVKLPQVRLRTNQPHKSDVLSADNIRQADKLLLAKVILRDLGGLAAEVALDVQRIKPRGDIANIVRSWKNTTNDTWRAYQVLSALYPELQEDDYIQIIKRIYFELSDFMDKHRDFLNLLSNFILTHQGKVQSDLTPDIMNYLDDNGYSVSDFKRTKSEFRTFIDKIVEHISN